MHKDEAALSPTQRGLRTKCIALHPDWEFKFWDDTQLDNFIATQFPSYHAKWIRITPLIKKLDTSRYMLMHHYGGIYMDVDVECVTNLDSLVEHLPPGAAWTGDFPEPMFLMSAPGNKFWLHVMDRVGQVWNKTDAWHSTGPAGLDEAFQQWVLQQGSAVLVPFITHRQEPEFHRFIKQKNNTIPWFQLANGNWDFMPGAAPHAIWRSPDHYRPGVPATTIVPPSKGALGVDMRVGFIANELLDPASCGAAVLAQCKGGWCNETWPLSYLVHHCMNTWRGRIGTT